MTFVASCRATKWLVTTVILERSVPSNRIRHSPTKLDLTVNLVTSKSNYVDPETRFARS